MLSNFSHYPDSQKLESNSGSSDLSFFKRFSGRALCKNDCIGKERLEKLKFFLY